MTRHAKMGLFMMTGFFWAGGTVACGPKSSSSGAMDAAITCDIQQDCPDGFVCDNHVCVPDDGGLGGDSSQAVPDISVDPNSLDFGTPPVGVPVTKTVTLRNEGNADLTISSVSLDEGGVLAEFSADPSGDMQRVIEPGGSMEVTVTLLSQDDEPDTGTLFVASDDPDEPVVEVALISALEGNSNLATCVMQAEDLFSNCVQNPETIDYGDLDFDATALAKVSLYDDGDGNRPLIVSDVHVTNESGHGDLFTLRFFRLMTDDQDSRGYREVEATDFPEVHFVIGPDDGQGAPEAVIVEVEFHATLDGQDVPAENLVFVQADPQQPQHLIPFAGRIACPPDHYDYDGQPGCEYECSVTNSGEEICDGVDNDCNGQTDEGVNPGLCLICDQTGTPVQAADDEDCGVVDCSNWFTRTGTSSPTETDECYAHENMTRDRCEAPQDCKDSNTSDCDAMPLLSAPVVSCGVCRHVSGCSGTTPGSCQDYPQGTDTGLCSECDGAGNEVASTDDNDCGVVDCSGWYAKQGTPGPTSTETCWGHQDITSDRCEGLGDCKDANTFDCDSQPLESAPAATCGICRYMTGCSGATAPQCVEYPAGTSTGLCGQCDGSGNQVVPSDDPTCGTIECGGWYTKQGTQGSLDTETCYGHQDITSNRCEGLADCKDANSPDCDSQPLEATAAGSCGICQYMVGCSGASAPQCVNYSNGTLTSGTCGTGVCTAFYHCDGSGNNVCTPGTATGPDTDCNGLDDDCDGTADNHYVSYTCGLGVCARQSTCTNATETCVPGSPQGADVPDDGFLDTDCDGIDGDESQALFVAVNGNDGWPGTKSQPKRTIQAAVSAAASSGKDVYISEGTYNESVTLRSNVSLYGGYSRTNGWDRADSYHVVIQGGTTALSCSGQHDIVLDHLEVRAANNTASGGSSYAVRLVSCNNVTIRRSTLVGDDGGAGAAGHDGNTGAAGSNGANGRAGVEDSSAWFCTDRSLPSPGNGGNGCSGNSGGRGGWPGNGGGNGQSGVAGTGPRAGAGGSGGTCDRDWNGSCGTVGACYNGRNGSDGGPGDPGSDGSAGSNFNTSSTSAYVVASGGAGTSGTAGSGGGGGGGGHGGDDQCDSDGSSGGGGGGGGCGGTGASGGQGGGGSFAIWTYSCSNVQVTNCALVTGNGGAGGAGGVGGSGGQGGSGGSGWLYGGSDDQDDGGCGGNGGHGGQGGRGGHGGGGGGGPSIGIVFHACSGCTQSGNTFSLGNAGAGGSSPANPGAAGRRTSVYSF